LGQKYNHGGKKKTTEKDEEINEGALRHPNKLKGRHSPKEEAGPGGGGDVIPSLVKTKL